MNVFRYLMIWMCFCTWWYACACVLDKMDVFLYLMTWMCLCTWWNGWVSVHDDMGMYILNDCDVFVYLFNMDVFVYLMKCVSVCVSVCVLRRWFCVLDHMDVLCTCWHGCAWVLDAMCVFYFMYFMTWMCLCTWWHRCVSLFDDIDVYLLTWICLGIWWLVRVYVLDDIDLFICLMTLMYLPVWRY